MTILGIDAALGPFSVALARGDAVTTDVSDRPDALERGLARVDALLRAAQLCVDDVERFAVGLGPGSFTGIRIALSYAKALATATRRPLVGVSSYDALEPAAPALPVLAVVHGRAGIISARLRSTEGMRSASGPIATVLDALLDGPPDALTVCTNTEDVVPALAERGWTVHVSTPRAAVPAAAIVAVAREAAPAGSPHALAPDYGEAPAVTPGVAT